MNLLRLDSFTFRRKGLPKRLRRIPGGIPGLVSACNVHVAGETPAAKVAFFKDRKSMRNFWDNILPKYLCDVKIEKLGHRCGGVVSKLHTIHIHGPTGNVTHEVDRNYFCLVALVEGSLTAEILAHEAVHVGFAWDMRTRGLGALHDRRNPEENIAYPAGIWLDQTLTFIKTEKLRET